MNRSYTDSTIEKWGESSVGNKWHDWKKDEKSIEENLIKGDGQEKV